MDGVTSYRLEMQTKAFIAGHKDLYELWGSRLYEAVRDDGGRIINLASKEYSKCIEEYLSNNDTFVTIISYEKSGDKLVAEGTYAKMVRGDMVRFMAEHKIEEPADLKKYDRLGYVFREELSQFIFNFLNRRK